MASTVRTVDLAGIPVRICAADEPLDRCAEWHFGELHSTTAQPRLRIDLVRCPPSVPDGAANHVDGPVHLWDQGRDLVLAHEDGGTAHLRGDHLLVGADPAPEALWRVVRQLLFSALSWYLGRQGRLVLHAALASLEDSALLLLGPTGSGKSTTAMALVGAGWRLHGDDLIVVGRPGALTDAFGLPKRMAVAPDVAQHLGSALPIAGPLPGDPRRRLMVSHGMFTVGWTSVTGVVVTGHDDGMGRADPLSHRSRLAALTASFLDAHDADAVRSALPHLAALAGLPAWRVRLAVDPAVRMHRAAALIETAVAEAAGH